MFVKATVKKLLKDPDSFKHVKTSRYLSDEKKLHMTIEMIYRAKNSFNATVTERAVMIVRVSEDG